MIESATNPDGPWPLKRLMTEVVGSGHKSAADMSRDQARESMARILVGSPDPTTLGAFWLANRWKRNSPTELAGFLDETIVRTLDRAHPEVDPVDCGAAYDGKHSTAILGIAAGATAAAAGTPVVVHSGARTPTQYNPVYRDVLDSLGVRTDLDPRESAAMVDETGVGYYHQPAFAPGIDALRDRRDTMGVRTFVNTIETLLNPAGAKVHLGSFYHLAFAKRIVETLQLSEQAQIDRTIMFQGLEGYDDVRPGSTTVAELDPVNGFSDFEIRSEEYGMTLTEEDLAVDDVAADSASITQAVLTGSRDGPFLDATLLNAGLRVYAGGNAASIGEGVELARTAISEGRAATVLDDLRSF